MRIAFFHNATWAWTAEDLSARGVGGTEMGLVNVARALARMGHGVTVYNRTPHAHDDAGVSFRHVDAFPRTARWDVLVCMSAMPDLRAVDARVKVHWSAATWTDVLPQADVVFSISPYHTDLLASAHGVPRERIFTTCCPIDPAEYASQPPKVPGRMIFCSVPDRGLRHMPDILRRVQARVAGATLAVTGDYTLWGLPGRSAAFSDLFAGLEGVELLGAVSRSRLVHLQQTATLHVYPCTFEELQCLASAECQAAGTPSVTTAICALRTTVQDGVSGVLVAPGVLPPNATQPYIELPPAAVTALADAAADLLQDAERCRRMATAARERAMSLFSADAVARRWVEEFERRMGRAG